MFSTWHCNHGYLQLDTEYRGFSRWVFTQTYGNQNTEKDQNSKCICVEYDRYNHIIYYVIQEV